MKGGAVDSTCSPITSSMYVFSLAGSAVRAHCVAAAMYLAVAPIQRYVMSEFQLVTRFEPAGDQPEAIRQLVEGIEAGLSHQTLLGVTGSGKTFSIANVIQQVQRPTLVLAPNKTLAAQLYGEFKAFFPNNAVEYFVSYYDYYQPEAYVPSSDTFIEKDASINDHIEQMRLSATKALLERKDAIIVTTVSCIYGLGSPETYLKHGAARGSRRQTRSARLAAPSGRPAIHPQRHGFRPRDLPRARRRDRHLSRRNRTWKRSASSCSMTKSKAFRAFDPLTGEVIRKLPRFTFYPKSHYVTPRETLLDAMEAHQGRAAGASGIPARQQQAGGGAASGAAYPFRPGDDPRAGLLQRHRKLLALSVRPSVRCARRRPCTTTCRPTRCW